MERWRPVVGYEGFYEVSDLGRVRSVFHGQGRRIDRVLKFSYDKNGRPSVGLYKVKAEYRRRIVGPLVLMAFVGPRPSGLECCHGDGNQTNNRLSNLRWDTHASNEKDKIKNGTTNRGERNGRARLRSADVVRMKSLWAAGWRVCDIASKFNIYPSYVTRILTGWIWRWN